MSADIPRTAYDEAAEALDMLDQLAREARNLRAHLTAATVDQAPGIALQARRSARIVGGLAGDLDGRVGELLRRATLEEQTDPLRLRSVS